MGSLPGEQDSQVRLRAVFAHVFLMKTMGPFPTVGSSGNSPCGAAREGLSRAEPSHPSDLGPLPSLHLPSLLPSPPHFPRFLLSLPSHPLPSSPSLSIPSPATPLPPPWPLENRREALWALRQHPVCVRSLGRAPAQPCYFIVHNHSHWNTEEPTGLAIFQHWVSIGVKSCLTKLIQDDAPENIVGLR